MSFQKDPREYGNPAITAYDPASITSNGTGAKIDLSPYTGTVEIVVTVSAATAGTNPTMDIAVTDSADNTTFAAVSPAIAITQVTTTKSVQSLFVDTRLVRRYIQLTTTIGGTASPAFTVAAVFLGQKQNQ